MKLNEFMDLFNEDIKTWTLKQETNKKTFDKQQWGTRTLQRKNKNGPVDLLRCEVTMRNVDCKKLWNYFTHPQKNSSIKEAKIIETLPNGDLIMYFRMKLPMMSDRDFTTICHKENLPD